MNASTTRPGRFDRYWGSAVPAMVFLAGCPDQCAPAPAAQSVPAGLAFYEDFSSPNVFYERFDRGWSGQDPATGRQTPGRSSRGSAITTARALIRTRRLGWCRRVPAQAARRVCSIRACPAAIRRRAT